ncbi:zinc finger protein 704-like isoform X2 [Lethenteron reissneri]|uniref:zinc finger protein 704-like isoform X2 n=2 Tax=Lethenteron reissneri TaxID=7753 RepID=UPI002AB71D29|nr:zinc finger protein 704-like isoform X2 [Lethenteron reissneri]
MATLCSEPKRRAVSSSIAVPHVRKKSGEADMNEVMAAMVLSSLSTSPLVRSPPGLSGPPGLSDAQSWHDAAVSAGMAAVCGADLAASFGSSSGVWSWDLPSDRSNPSTPSPPLPGDSIPLSGAPLGNAATFAAAPPRSTAPFTAAAAGAFAAAPFPVRHGVATELARKDLDFSRGDVGVDGRKVNAAAAVAAANAAEFQSGANPNRDAANPAHKKKPSGSVGGGIGCGGGSGVKPGFKLGSLSMPTTTEVPIPLDFDCLSSSPSSDSPPSPQSPPAPAPPDGVCLKRAALSHVYSSRLAQLMVQPEGGGSGGGGRGHGAAFGEAARPGRDEGVAVGANCVGKLAQEANRGGTTPPAPVSAHHPAFPSSKPVSVPARRGVARGPAPDGPDGAGAAGAAAAAAFSDDGHDGHAAQSELLFEEPSPRKRKNSMKVMFKCMWPNCEKVLSTSSGIQRHIRTIHLGRNGDSDLSDGEEDFYYTEVEVSVESVTDGLSSLSAVSPTVCHLPSVVVPPHPHHHHNNNNHPHHLQQLHQQQQQLQHRGDGRGVLPLSHSAPTAAAFWHVRADHAYQATPPLSVPVGESGRGVGMSLGSVSWQSPTFSSPVQVSPTRPRVATVAEHRLQHHHHHHAHHAHHPHHPHHPHHAASPKAHVLLSCSPKSGPGVRKIRGEGKKCRKVYGMENKDMWCTACRWKKACQRFLD